MDGGGRLAGMWARMSKTQGWMKKGAGVSWVCTGQPAVTRIPGESEVDPAPRGWHPLFVAQAARP